jgi:hypothetical protein
MWVGLRLRGHWLIERFLAEHFSWIGVRQNLEMTVDGLLGGGDFKHWPDVSYTNVRDSMMHVAAASPDLLT